MRSPETTSSISFTERSWPTASGVIDSGKTTVSFSGSTGSFHALGRFIVCGRRSRPLARARARFATGSVIRSIPAS